VATQEATASPLVLLLFEAGARAMGLTEGMENLFLGFENGRLRRWSRRDEGNGAREPARFDQAAAHELRDLLDPR
jgi:hypothetical protein